MPEPRKFVAYTREILKKGKVVRPDAGEQLTRIRGKIAAHPHGMLLAEFQENGEGSFPRLKEAFTLCLDSGAKLVVCDHLQSDEVIAAAMHEEEELDVILIHPGGDAPTAPASAGNEQNEVFLIAPNHGDGASVTFTALMERIAVECSDYIRDVKKTRRLLFRGASKRDADAYLLSPRKDRQPRDTPAIFHSRVSALMTEQGFFANRANSLFTTADAQMAEAFAEEPVDERFAWEAVPSKGCIYAIFPCNGFRFTWSRNFRDFGRILRERKLREETSAVVCDEVLAYDLPHLVWRAEFASWDFQGALRSGHEVMIAEAPYYAVLWSDLSGAEGRRLGFQFPIGDFLNVTINAKAHQDTWVRHRAEERAVLELIREDCWD